MAPDSCSRGRVCHRQYFQLPTPHLTLYCQLSSGTVADLSWENAAGHSEIPLHLLPGKHITLGLQGYKHANTSKWGSMQYEKGKSRVHWDNLSLPQVLLAFANGLNQLYFYYETKASDEKGKCKGIRCVEQNNAFSTWVFTCVYEDGLFFKWLAKSEDFADVVDTIWKTCESSVA